VLDEYTLGDLVRPRAPLQAMLAIAPVKTAKGPSPKRSARQAIGNG
jgi:hypothetical protein